MIKGLHNFTASFINFICAYNQKSSIYVFCEREIYVEKNFMYMCIGIGKSKLEIIKMKLLWYLVFYYSIGRINHLLLFLLLS